MQKVVPMLPQSVIRIAAIIVGVAATVAILPTELAANGVVLPPEFLAMHAVALTMSICKGIVGLGVVLGIVSHGAHSGADATTPVQP